MPCWARTAKSGSVTRRSSVWFAYGCYDDSSAANSVRPRGCGDPDLDTFEWSPLGPRLRGDERRVHQRKGIGLQTSPVDDPLGSWPRDPIAELDRLFLIRRQRHVPGQHAALVLDVAPRRRRAALQLDLDRVILRYRDLIEHT